MNKTTLSLMWFFMWFCMAHCAQAQTIEVNLEDWEFMDVADEGLVGYDVGQGRLFWYINARAESKVKIAQEGEYTLVILASCTPGDGELAKFRLSVDDREIGEETELKSEEAEEYKFTVKLKAGTHTLAIEFTNDKYKEGEYDLNFFVHEITLKAK